MISEINPVIFAYELLTTFFPDVIIIITSEIEYNILAINEHKSQISNLRYDNLIRGLNMYRASFIPFPNMVYAEAFKKFRSSDYIGLIDQNLDVLL